MDIKKLRKINLGILLVVFIGVFYFQYNYRFKLRTQPPSDKWGKEVYLSEGNITTPIKVGKYGEDYIVAYNDGTKLKLIKVDKFGKVLEKSKDIGETGFIKDTNISIHKSNIYLNWIESSGGKYNLNSVKFNGELQDISKDKMENIYECEGLNDEALITASKDQINIKDLNLNTISTVSEVEPSYLRTYKVKDAYLVTYYVEEEGVFKYFTYNNGVLSTPEIAGKFGIGINKNFNDVALVAKDNEAYITIEVVAKGEYIGTNYIKFSLDNGENSTDKLEVGNNNYIKYISPVKNEKNIEILGTTDRVYGIKSIQKDIVDVIIKDEKTIEKNYVSRSDTLSIYATAIDDSIFFADFKENNTYEIYMTSKNEEFKKMHNGIRNAEKKKGLLDAFEGLMFTAAYLFIIGAKWWFPAFILVSLFSFFEYKFKEKSKKGIYIGICIISTVFKILTIKSVFYERYLSYMPSMLSSTLLGITISIVISIITYYSSYLMYKKDVEITSLFRFAPALLIDSFLTLMMFVPFII